MDLSNKIIGLVLGDNWKVEAISEKYKGHFSSGFIVINSDTEKVGYLKVLDIENAVKHETGDFLEQLKKSVDKFLFERNLYLQCKDERLRRIVTALDYGEITLDSNPIPIPYVIFEYADEVSKEKKELIQENIDIAVALKILHGVFIGIRELHTNGIAHQDIKPSNVLMFENDFSKVTDLGRASSKNCGSEVDKLICAGDTAYSPPELLYREPSINWNERRVSCDLYMLGSLLVYYFSPNDKARFNLIWISKIDSGFHPSRFGGSYADILPILIKEFEEIYITIEESIPELYRADIILIIRELTNPLPSKRGFSRNIGKFNQYYLDPYISKLGNLTRKAEINLGKIK